MSTTTVKRPGALPLSDAARLDREIGERIHRIASGRVAPGDASAASRLIRQRAELMMPKALRPLIGANVAKPGRR
jgi:hypothetical protein